MLRLALSAALLLLPGCKIKAEQSAVTDAKIEAKYWLYLSLAKEQADERNEFGAVYANDCDSLLWNGLYNFSGGPVQIDAFREGHKWYRRTSKDCYGGKPGDSDISRDMLLGLYFSILAAKRKDLAIGLIEYAEDNGFVMGRGPVSKTAMTSNMMGLLGRIAAKLGHWNKYQYWPVVYIKPLRGYEAHLQVLGIVLYWKIHQYTRYNHQWIITEHYKRNPKNGLFVLAYALMVDPTVLKDVKPILMDEKHFPNDKLPTKRENHCEPYLWQREDKPKDWAPCNRSSLLYGVDFLFVTALYLDR